MKKKLNHFFLVKMVFMIFLLGIFLFFYQLYSDFNLYTILKKEPGTIIVKDKSLRQRKIILFSKSKFRQLDRFDIFSKGNKYDEKKTGLKVNSRTDDFILLGVVRVGKLFAVIQFKKDKKIKLLPEQSSINQNSFIEKVGVYYVLIRGRDGNVRKHKVFKYEEVKKIKDEDLQKFINSPSLSKPRGRKKTKRSPRRNG